MCVWQKRHLIRELNGGAERVHQSIEDCLADPSPLIRRYALLAECLIRSDTEVEAMAERGLAHLIHPKIMRRWNHGAIGRV